MIIEYLYLLKWKLHKIYRYLTTHKCKANGCDRRLDGNYKWCGFECYVYDGNKLEDLHKEN